MNGNFKDRTGEVRTMNNGLEATIIEYRSYDDVDIQFSNGGIARHRRYGKFKVGEIKCPMMFEYFGDYAKAINPNIDFAFLIDTEDVELLGDGLWCCDAHGYVVNGAGGKMKKLHRLVMRTSDDVDVDHKSGDKLDYRKSNLRICTHAENMRNQKKSSDNTSGHKGVSWEKRRSIWRASIVVDGKQTYLGSFTDKNEAARAYNSAALKLFGEFARLNVV